MRYIRTLNTNIYPRVYHYYLLLIKSDLYILEVTNLTKTRIPRPATVIGIQPEYQAPAAVVVGHILDLDQA